MLRQFWRDFRAAFWAGYNEALIRHEIRRRIDAFVPDVYQPDPYAESIAEALVGQRGTTVYRHGDDLGVARGHREGRA
jgi:hypothetical protein